MIEINQQLYDLIMNLKQRVEILENENVEMSRMLQNQIEAVDNRIDILLGENDNLQ